MDIFSIFITGLFAGGLTCLAVQGGLLATSIAQQETEKLEERAKLTGQVIPIISFLGARLVGYTVLGLLLGGLGSVVQLSITTRVILQIAVSLFMIGTALNLLNIHPIFRYLIIQPPKFLTRLVRNQSKSKSVFGPALLGMMTVFIPCGATQAMMAYAVSTGSPLTGAITMFTFILGTSPLFFLFGYVAKNLGTSFSLNFNKVAAVAIILVALFNINGAVALTGSGWTLENVWDSVSQRSSVAGTSTESVVTEATIYFDTTSYRTEPAGITFKAGSKVRINLVNKSGSGCIQAFTIPAYKFQEVVPVGTSKTIELTAPSQPGTLNFMCSMGMYRGTIKVI
jgi:sulfite exporter TauE/SafE